MGRIHNKRNTGADVAFVVLDRYLSEMTIVALCQQSHYSVRAGYVQANLLAIGTDIQPLSLR